MNTSTRYVLMAGIALLNITLLLLATGGKSKSSCEINEEGREPEYKAGNTSETPYLETCLKAYRRELGKGNYAKVVNGLARFITVEPPVGPSSSCKKPPPVPKVKCEDYKSAFGNNVKRVKKSKQPKVAILIQFGFDVDMLEAYLWEVYDVVDKFFITESLVTHSNRQIRKPLVWDMVKSTPRFERFAEKVVHLVVDDAEMRLPNGDIWLSERWQEYMRWKKFLEWNEQHKFFKDTDIIGFGDADEIPSRKAVAALKQCTGTIDAIDVASIFFYGDYDTVFPTDWPVSVNRYSYGDPTFFTIRSAKAYEAARRDTPSRRKGQGSSYMVGGAHISPYMYLSLVINKFLVATEYTMSQIPDKPVDEVDAYFTELVTRDLRAQGRLVSAKDVKAQIKDIHFIPWFIECNPDRFPRFYKKKDPRVYYPKSKFNFKCL